MLDRQKFPKNPEELKTMLIAEDIFSSAIDPEDLPGIIDSWDDKEPDGYIPIYFDWDDKSIPIAVPYWRTLSPLQAAIECGYYDSIPNREFLDTIVAFSEEEAIEIFRSQS